MDSLLTAAEVSAWARVSLAKVSSAARTGALQGQKIGRDWRFTIEAVRMWSGFSDLSVEDVKAASEQASV